MSVDRTPRERGVEMLAWRGESARLEHHGVGPDGLPMSVIHPTDGRPLSAGFIRYCLERLAPIGGSVTSPALGFDEVDGFVGAGFRTRADLHLLVHDLSPVPARPTNVDVITRKGAAPDLDAVLAVDRAAFAPIWYFDEIGILGAFNATPSVRYRVALDGHGSIVAYAITGRAGRRGYLQRLAVSPEHQGRGIARLLIADGLSWCRRWRVQRVAVNTQHGNIRALDLYRRLGFVDVPAGLRVMEHRLGPSVIE
jgi:ribosomal protein S18 acetylase RimI-like enzyme